MQITTTFKTKRNYSPVLKINDQKFLCLDKDTLRVYRTCTDINELFETEPFIIDFDFPKLLERNEKDMKELQYLFSKKDKEVSELKDEIYFIEKTLNIPSIYEHCLKLKLKQDKEVETQRKKTISLNAKKHGLSIKEYENFISIIKAKNFNTDHKMGCSVVIKIDDKIAYTSNNEEEYAKSSKYRATHGSVNLTFTKKEAKTMQLIGGVITCLGKKIDKHITEANVILVKGGYKVSLQRNKEYITSGYHGKTIEDCENWRKIEAQRLILKRKGLADQEIKMELAKYKYVGFDHSLKAGNCESGTRQFARDHNLNTKFGYNLAYLISLDPTNYYIQKML